MSEVRIERAGRVDALAVAALALQMERESPEAIPRAGFLREYADAWLADFERRPVWLASEDDGAAVGFIQSVQIQKLPRLRGPARSWLHLSQVFVTARRRQQGVGAQLLAAMQDWARHNGVDFVQLNARPGVRGFYAAAGFAAAERRMEWRP